jgi:hypothetical protein
MTKSLIQSVVASNREAWNASAAHHRKADSWKTLLASVSRAEFSCLDDTITKLLVKIGIDGKRVIQLGCFGISRSG